MVVTLEPLMIMVACLMRCSLAQTGTDFGDGTVYNLQVTQDVTLESGSSNYNSMMYLLVGKHPGYPNKRSLLQFQDLPSTCSVCDIRWAKMYVSFSYAHKASSRTVQQVPYRSRPIQVYQVNKEWSESESTSIKRLNGGFNWDQQYLSLTGSNADAGPDVVDTVTIFTAHPRGFVEFDVTTAVKNWRGGENNYGVLLRATNEYIEGRGIRFFSNAHSDATTHAYINVLCDSNQLCNTTMANDEPNGATTLSTDLSTTMANNEPNDETTLSTDLFTTDLPCGEDSIQTWMIILVVCGLFVIIIIVNICIAFYCKRRKMSTRQHHENNSGTGLPPSRFQLENTPKHTPSPYGLHVQPATDPYSPESNMYQDIDYYETPGINNKAYKKDVPPDYEVAIQGSHGMSKENQYMGMEHSKKGSEENNQRYQQLVNSNGYVNNAVRY